MNQSLLLVPSSPYKNILDGKVLITRAELNLIKLLRHNGLDISVAYDADKEVYYVVEKGIKEFIEHPLTLFLIGIPLSVMLNILSNHLDDELFGKSEIRSEIILQQEKDRKTVSFNQEGKELSEETIKTIFEEANSNFFIEDYRSQAPASPNKNKHPHPIYLNHTNKIIGWGEIFLGEKGLMLKNGVITDKETKKLLDDGVYRGISITGASQNCLCSICKGDYLQCEHISGAIYNGVMCSNTINSIELININLVKEPVNPEALLEL